MLVVRSMKENGRTIKNMGRLMNEAVLPVAINAHVSKFCRIQSQRLKASSFQVAKVI